MKTQSHLANEIPSVKWDTSKESNDLNLTSATEIKAWLCSYLAELLEIEPLEVDVTIPFDRYGLDSSAVIGFTGDLGDWLGRELDPTIMYDYPTVEALVQYLSEESSGTSPI